MMGHGEVARVVDYGEVAWSNELERVGQDDGVRRHEVEF